MQQIQGNIDQRIDAVVNLKTFESFASNLKDELDNAPCVQPSRFKPMAATIEQSQLYSAQPSQLPES